MGEAIKGDPLRLAPGSLGWAALSILEPSTIKKKPSSPASWESTCGDEGQGAVLSVGMQGAPSSRACSESTCTAEMAISLKFIRGHQRSSEAIRGHQSSESTCTAEIAISLKLGTWDAISGHLRSISHGMFVSLKRPGEGRRGEHLHASRSEGKVRLAKETEQRLGAALRHRSAERCGEQLVARLHILVASGAEKASRSLVREGRVRVGGGLGGVVEPGIRGDIRGALRGALSMQSALSVQSAVQHAISGPLHAISPAAASEEDVSSTVGGVLEGDRVLQVSMAHV